MNYRTPSWADVCKRFLLKYSGTLRHMACTILAAIALSVSMLLERSRQRSFVCVCAYYIRIYNVCHPRIATYLLSRAHSLKLCKLKSLGLPLWIFHAFLEEKYGDSAIDHNLSGIGGFCFVSYRLCCETLVYPGYVDDIFPRKHCRVLLWYSVLPRKLRKMHPFETGKSLHLRAISENWWYASRTSRILLLLSVPPRRMLPSFLKTID